MALILYTQGVLHFCMFAIITCGLYILNPLLEGQKRLSLVGFFLKILALSMVSILERFLIKR